MPILPGFQRPFSARLLLDFKQFVQLVFIHHCLHLLPSQCQCNEWQKGHYTEYAQPNEPLQPLTTDTVGRHINGQDKTTPDINRHIKHIKHIKQHQI